MGRCTKVGLPGWEGVGEAARPLLAILNREGLIDELVVSTYGSAVRCYAPSGHGRLLLKHLTSGDFGSIDLGTAALAFRVETDPDINLVIRTLGPGTADHIVVDALPNGGSQH